MSSVEEILRKRQELADKQAQRAQAEQDAVATQRQAELEKESAKLDAQLAEEETIANLLAAAGQNPEASEVSGTVRTDEEILAAHDAAVAAVTGGPVEKKKAEDVPAPAEAPKSDAPRLTGGATPPAQAATTEQEK